MSLIGGEVPAGSGAIGASGRAGADAVLTALAAEADGAATTAVVVVALRVDADPVAFDAAAWAFAATGLRIEGAPGTERIDTPSVAGYLTLLAAETIQATRGNGGLLVDI
jgi:hypothetical protein